MQGWPRICACTSRPWMRTCATFRSLFPVMAPPLKKRIQRSGARSAGGCVALQSPTKRPHFNPHVGRIAGHPLIGTAAAVLQAGAKAGAVMAPCTQPAHHALAAHVLIGPGCPGALAKTTIYLWRSSMEASSPCAGPSRNPASDPAAAHRSRTTGKRQTAQPGEISLTCNFPGSPAAPVASPA